jgi:circadian clock protein KaiC
MKLRGVKFRGGYHDFVIEQGGVHVFPRLVAAEHHSIGNGSVVSSGIKELDALLGGGLTRGTSMLIIGPAGSGKTSIALQYIDKAAAAGERCAAYLFDEGVGTMMMRAQGIGMHVQDAIGKGKVGLRQIDPAELSPGEFVELVRREVEENQAKLIVIDSLNGYLNAMPEERFLLLHMHELLSYLAQKGVLTILIMAQHGLMGRTESPLDLSYLSDGVLLTRYFEAHGSIRLAISVVKKRTGVHERTIREMSITPQGIKVGPALVEFQGVLTGVPTFLGGQQTLMKKSIDAI